MHIATYSYPCMFFSHCLLWPDGQILLSLILNEMAPLIYIKFFTFVLSLMHVHLLAKKAWHFVENVIYWYSYHCFFFLSLPIEIQNVKYLVNMGVDLFSNKIKRFTNWNDANTGKVFNPDEMVYTPENIISAAVCRALCVVQYAMCVANGYGVLGYEALWHHW